MGATEVAQGLRLNGAQKSPVLQLKNACEVSFSQTEEKLNLTSD